MFRTNVTVTRKELIANGACPSGLAMHAAIVALQGRKHSVHVPTWTPLHDAWLAVAQPSFVLWLRNNGLVPTANLSGANLYRADLYGADLYGADLYGADLSRANMSGARRYTTDAPIAGWRLDNGALVKK